MRRTIFLERTRAVFALHVREYFFAYLGRIVNLVIADENSNKGDETLARKRNALFLASPGDSNPPNSEVQQQRVVNVAR